MAVSSVFYMFNVYLITGADFGGKVNMVNFYLVINIPYVHFASSKPIKIRLPSTIDSGIFLIGLPPLGFVAFFRIRDL